MTLAARPPRIKDRTSRPPTSVLIPSGLGDDGWWRMRPVIAGKAGLYEIENCLSMGEIAQLHLALDVVEDVEIEASNRAHARQKKA